MMIISILSSSYKIFDEGIQMEIFKDLIFIFHILQRARKTEKETKRESEIMRDWEGEHEMM